MIMDASREEGQSLLEFLVMLPLMAGMVVILVRINIAIQSGIVNQQYARAAALFYSFNSAFFPERQFQEGLKSNNQFIVGVSETAPGSVRDFEPDAPIVSIVRKKNSSGNNDNRTEPKLRGRVRVRNSVTLCTYTWFPEQGFCGGPAQYE